MLYLFMNLFLKWNFNVLETGLSGKLKSQKDKKGLKEESQTAT